MIFHLVIILNIKIDLFYKSHTIQPLKKPHFYYIDNIYHLENFRNKFLQKHLHFSFSMLQYSQQ